MPFSRNENKDRNVDSGDGELMLSDKVMGKSFTFLSIETYVQNCILTAIWWNVFVQCKYKCIDSFKYPIF